MKQFGSIHLILLSIMGIIILISAFYIFNAKKITNPTQSTPSAPSPSLLIQETEKQKSYEENKEDIKAKLNLSEEEFQALKRFSAD